jgi:hypothetical protein
MKPYQATSGSDKPDYRAFLLQSDHSKELRQSLFEKDDTLVLVEEAEFCAVGTTLVINPH